MPLPTTSPLHNQAETPTVQRILAMLRWAIEQDITMPGNTTLTDRQANIHAGQLTFAVTFLRAIEAECRTGEMVNALPEEGAHGPA